MTVERRAFLLSMLLLAGCTQLPPTSQDLEAKKFEAVPGRAVVYLVRDVADFSPAGTPVNVGDKVQVTTYPGTYYRWVAAPGNHTIAGAGQDYASITVQAEAGRIHFVQQQVVGTRAPSSAFQLVGEAQGRPAVMRSVLLVPGQ
jgi:hypothetical protein